MDTIAEESDVKPQICRSINEHPVYKVKVWLSAEKQETYVFIGKTPEHKDILHKLHDKHVLTAAERQKIIKHYGQNYKNKLGIDANAKFVYETIYYDDNLNTVRKKICMYVLGEIDDGNIYTWCDREVKNTAEFRLGFAKHILKGEKSIDTETFETIWKNYLGRGVSFPETSRNKWVLDDILDALNEIRIESVSTPLGFRYIRDGYTEFVPVNPFNNTTNKKRNINLENEGSTTIETYKIKTNTIHVTTYRDVSDTKYVRDLYFPNYNAGKKLLPESIKIFKDYDNIQHRVLDSVSNISGMSVECHTNFVHLRLNESSINKTIQMKKLFESVFVSEKVPFIKYNTSTIKQYKMDKTAFSSVKYKISKKDFDAWIESNPNDIKGRSSKEFVMFKIFAKSIDGVNKFTTLVVFPDTHIDIKVNIRNNDDMSFESIFHAIPAVNKVLEQIRSVVSKDIYIPNVEHNFWNKHETFTSVKLVNFASTVDLKRGNLKAGHLKELAKIMFPYFNVVEYDNEKNNVVSLQYKRINNFVKVDNIQNFLNQNRGLEKRELLGELVKAFGISNEDALKYYGNWQDKQALEAVAIGNRYFFRPFHSNTVSVKIQVESTGLKVRIEGISNLKYHKRIIGLLKYLIEYSDPKKRKDLNKYSKNMDADDIIYQAPDERDGNMYLGDMTDSEDDVEAHDDIGEYDTFEETVFPDNDAEETVFPNSDAPVYQNNDDDAPVYPSDPNETDEKEIKATRRGNTDVSFVIKNSGDIIKMLKKADPIAFEKASTKCQSHDKRQPIVITPEQKQAIDKSEFGPESYDNNFIAYGTTEARRKKNIYICPEVWCPISNLSMTYEQFVKQGKKCPGVDEPVINLEHKKWKTTNDERKVRYIGFAHGKQCIPCCFSKQPKLDNNNKPNENLKRIQECVQDNPAENSKMTSAIAESLVPDTSKYIVGPQFPLDVARFGVLPFVLSRMFKNTKCGDGKYGTGNIVRDTDCFVRRGISHKYDNSFISFLSCMNFLLDLEKEDMRQHLIDNIDLKSFVLLNNGSLCSLFIDKSKSIYDDNECRAFFEWFTSDTRIVKDYILSFKLNDLLENIKIYKNAGVSMRTITKTDVVLKSVKKSHKQVFQYILREYLIYNAYTNFRKYLADDDYEKDSDILMDIFNKESAIFNPQGFNIILLEVENDSVSMSCPFDTQQTLNLTRPFVFLVKQEKYYEPICRVKMDGTVVARFKFFYGEEPNTTEIIDFYKNNCKRYKRSFTTGYSLFTYLGTDTRTLKILYQVIDYSYQLVGFIVSVSQKDADNRVVRTKLFLPCHPQRPIINSNAGVMFIYTDQITENITDIDATNYNIFKRTIEKLYDLTRDEMYKVSKPMSNSSGYLSCIMKNGAVIPLSKSFKNNNRYLDNLNLFVEWEDDDPRKLYIEDQEYKEMLYQILKTEVVKIIQKHKNLYYKDVLFLVSPDNPFSVEYKHKKMSSIIEKIVGSIAVETVQEPELDKDRCTGLTKRVCNGICTWKTTTDPTKGSCKVQIPKRLFCFYKDRLTDAFLKHEQRVIKFKLKNGDNYEIRFDQKDVIDGKITKIQKALSNPYMFVDSMIENYVKSILDKNVKVVSKPKLQDLLGPDYKMLPVELFKQFNLRTRDDKITNHDFCVNVLNDDEKLQNNPRDFVYNIFYVVSKLINSRAKITKATFVKIVENSLIDDAKNAADKREFLDNLKNQNQSLDHYIHDRQKDLDRFNISELTDFMKGNDYRMSEYEFKIMAELLGVKFFILGTKGKRAPNRVKCIKPSHKTKYFICLFRKIVKNKTDSYDKYELIVKNKKNPKIVFNVDDFQTNNIEDKELSDGYKNLLKDLEDYCKTDLIKTVVSKPIKPSSSG